MRDTNNIICDKWIFYSLVATHNVDSLLYGAVAEKSLTINRFICLSVCVCVCVRCVRGRYCLQSASIHRSYAPPQSNWPKAIRRSTHMRLLFLSNCPIKLFIFFFFHNATYRWMFVFFILSIRGWRLRYTSKLCNKIFDHHMCQMRGQFGQLPGQNRW